MPVTTGHAIPHKILRWFDDNARILPWRNPPGAPLPTGDPNWPYRVWLSEIMLQQTTVAAATPYFERFTRRWPSVTDLAAAEDGEVMQAWAGLGYYARARNLLACAREVVRDHGGHFPDDEDGLRALPGVGSYTAAAIAAFAFGKRAVVIDGNVERVTARLFALSGKKDVPAHITSITPQERAGDFAQGLMDLARAICTPRNPKCLICPVSAECAGKATPEAYPARPVKRPKPQRHGTAWWIERDGEVLLVRRPAKGLLGGMRGLPGDGWDQAPPLLEGKVASRSDDEGVRPREPTPPSRLRRATSPTSWGGTCLGTITHVFTHFRLTLDVVALPLENSCAKQLAGEWWPIDRLDQAGLPSLFAKAVRLGIAKKESA